MTSFKAEVMENIPPYRLIGLQGVGSGEDYKDNWEVIQLKLAGKGWIPDFEDAQEGITPYKVYWPKNNGTGE